MYVDLLAAQCTLHCTLYTTEWIVQSARHKILSDHKSIPCTHNKDQRVCQIWVFKMFKHCTLHCAVMSSPAMPCHVTNLPTSLATPMRLLWHNQAKEHLNFGAFWWQENPLKCQYVKPLSQQLWFGRGSMPLVPNSAFRERKTEKLRRAWKIVRLLSQLQ